MQLRARKSACKTHGLNSGIPENYVADMWDTDFSFEEIHRLSQPCNKQRQPKAAGKFRLKQN